MKVSKKDNGKVSDSGYTNTYISQSPRSSGSSLSKNSKRSESSGYCGGNPSTFGSSSYALPQPISQRKEYKKKNSEAATKILGDNDKKLGAQIIDGKQNDNGSYNYQRGSSSDFKSQCEKSEEVARVESIDATELGGHNGDSNSTEPEGGVGTKTNPLDDITSNTNEGFTAVISLHNGLVVDTTPSLKAALGYARDAWVGQSFIDFVHPKDKSTFAEHLAKNIALPYGNRDADINGRQTSLFCSLRKHDEGRLFATGSGSDESNSFNSRKSLFLPFHLTMSITLFGQCTKEEMPRVMFLTITAQAVLPVYKAPEETIISSIFLTRHDPNCILTYVDHDAVRYFGYLPQDIIGRSLFDFYHPEDLPFIKDVYETVVKMEGSPFRSKPYRFATQNGDYVVLETEWSSFVNPWKEKIDFVEGRHRILRGPANPDVFQSADDFQRSILSNISEEVFKESKIIQGEIRALLDEKIQRRGDIDSYGICRSKDLTTFVENLLREVKPPIPIAKDSVPADDKSISEHDSVMLGAISPHHEYCDSKSSTETPPSYNQLNYNDKIERFFNSNPHVSTFYGIGEENVNYANSSNEDIGKSSQNLTGTKDTTPNDSGSGENLSSGSNIHTSYGSRDSGDNARNANTMPPESLKPLTLTEKLLNKHNIDMEKLIAKQHKERRSEIKNNNKQLNNSKIKETVEKINEQDNKRGKSRNGKRCNSRSQSGGPSKVSKIDETVKTVTSAPVTTNNTPATPICVDDPTPIQASARPIADNRHSVPVTAARSQQTSHVSMLPPNAGIPEISRCSSFSPIVPIYYLSVLRNREEFVNTMPHPVSNQFLHNGQIQQNSYVPYVTTPLVGVMYPPMVCTPAPASTMYTSFVTPRPAPIPRESSHSNSVVQPQENSSHLKRPASQATSVKAERGSTIAMSESSKKVQSPGEHFSSCVSIDGGCSSLVNAQTTGNTKRETDTNSQFASSLEDSSDSSFYGSFLNTTSDSSCNREQSAGYPPPKTLWKPVIFKPTLKNQEQYTMLRKGPPWQEGVNMTPELIYQYQLSPKPLSEVLEADKKALQHLNQPQMVNEQLAQLYSDLELGGFEAKLNLSHADSSSDERSESSDNSPKITPEHKRVRKEMNASTTAMIYEENAPLPSP